MKYILLDTNIVIDMVIDRRHQVTDKILSSFIKLLDYDEIKLIVPEIVKIETHRHLKEELTLVGKQIKKVMKNIDDLYGIATYTIAGLDIQEYKNQSKQELAKAYTMYEKNEDKYKSDLIKTIDMVFNHKNSIIIPCDDFLINAVTKRKIYKRAPFHIDQKESYGDALIAETLINLGRYVPLESSDEIFFVTGNYIDFCVGKNDKTTLHPDIVNDINAENIPCKVNCINTFGQLIGKELKDNVESANLSAEFAEQYEEDMIQLEIDIQNMDRESADLTRMDRYPYKLEEDLINSNFASDIIEKFEELNQIYATFQDEDYNVIYEELNDRLKHAHITDVFEILTRFKNIFDQSSKLPNIGSNTTKNFTIMDFTTVLKWLDRQQELIEDILSIDYLPDSIEYGDIIQIKNSKFNTLEFSIDNLLLNPEEGSSENIDMRLSTSDGIILATGYVSVTYGFIEFNYDGNVGNGLADDINYNYDAIIDSLKEIISEWEYLLNEQIEITSELKEEFDIDTN